MPQNLYGNYPVPQTSAVCPYIVSLTMCFTFGRVGGTESYPFWNYSEGLDLRWRKWALDEIYESRVSSQILQIPHEAKHGAPHAMFVL